MLRRTHQPETLHPPLAQSRGLVGLLRPVVAPGRRMHSQMLGARQVRQALESRPVAAQAIGHDLLGRRTRMAEQRTEESLRRIGIPVLLQEDVQHLAVLVDRPPEVLLLSTYPHEHLVQVPGAAGSTLS